MQLTTDRLVLREFVPQDWRAVLRYQVDPAYLRYNSWTDRTAEDVQRFVLLFVEQQRAQPRTKFQLAVTQRAEGRLIGICGLRRETASATEAEIGYELAPEHWGMGFASEAVRAIVGFGFGTLGLHRITARCVADNVASARVLEKAGMRQEGRLREHEWFKGRWWDTLLYAMLETKSREHTT